MQDWKSSENISKHSKTLSHVFELLNLATNPFHVCWAFFKFTAELKLTFYSWVQSNKRSSLAKKACFEFFSLQTKSHIFWVCFFDLVNISKACKKEYCISLKKNFWSTFFLVLIFFKHALFRFFNVANSKITVLWACKKSIHVFWLLSLLKINFDFSSF